MRRAAKVDRNHGAIVAALRAAGATVQSLASVGNGCPDLLVAWGQKNHLLEAKALPVPGKVKPSEARLTSLEDHWHLVWNGPVYVVRTPEEALRAIGAIP